MDVTYANSDIRLGSQEGRQHKDLRRTEVLKREKRVEKSMVAIQSFLKPFKVSDHDKPHCISSGVPTPAPVEEYMMTAEPLGKQANIAFITGRLDIKEHFFDPAKS